MEGQAGLTIEAAIAAVVALMLGDEVGDAGTDVECCQIANALVLQEQGKATTQIAILL